jgi:hypothetical protein
MERDALQRRQACDAIIVYRVSAERAPTACVRTNATAAAVNAAG